MRHQVDTLFLFALKGEIVCETLCNYGACDKLLEEQKDTEGQIESLPTPISYQ